MDYLEWHNTKAALDWQYDLGVTEVIGDAPLNRYELPEKLAKPALVKTADKAKTAKPALPSESEGPDVVALAERAASGAKDLDGLRAAMMAYPHCELARGAKNLVFADGTAGARVMIIGEAPGRDEDSMGKPFVGRAGQLLDKMLAAINLDRETSVYITNILPWRPPQNRDPKPAELAMMMPFVRRHVALAKPDLLICMGNHSCQAILGKRGITRLRGKWDKALDLPVMPMLHPDYLLRQPAAKRNAWEDLLEVQAWLRNT